MSTIQLDLPADVRSELEGLGLTDESRIVAWVSDAVREKLAAMKQLEYLEMRSKRGDKATFEQILAKIPAVEPAEEDRWEFPSSRLSDPLRQFPQLR